MLVFVECRSEGVFPVIRTSVKYNRDTPNEALNKDKQYPPCPSRLVDARGRSKVAEGVPSLTLLLTVAADVGGRVEIDRGLAGEAARLAWRVYGGFE